MEKPASLTIVGILGKSLKTTFKNGKLVLSIMLFVFFSLSFLELGGRFVTKPLLKDLSYKSSKVSTNQYNDLSDFNEATLKDLPYKSSKVATHQYNALSDFDEATLKDLSYKSSKVATLQYNALSDFDEASPKDLSDFHEDTLKDIKIILLLKLGALVLSCATLLFFSIATISSSSAAYTAKTLTLNDMVLCVREKWTSAFITAIYMSFLSVAVCCFFIISLGVGTILTHGFGSYALKIGTSVLLGIVCSSYLSVLWMLSLVVSVVEDKCSGLKAIDKAKEILKGKRLKACVIMVLFTIVGIAVYISYYVVEEKFGRESWVRLGVQISRIWSLCLVNFFMFVVYTLFYHDCKKSENDGEVEGKSALYLPIASGDV